MVDKRTTTVDAGGGVAMPGFHDAHLHLLSYARRNARVDCHGAVSLGGLVERIAARAQQTLPGIWIRATGFDEYAVTEHELPDRTGLDQATTDHPVRLQHRSLHLDVLNTAALRQTGIWSEEHPAIERDALTGEPTGRLFHAADLLRHRLPRPSFAELARDVRAASEQMASFGLTTIQDASVTNGSSEWQLFHRLSEGDHLAGLRLFMMPGLKHWRDVIEERKPRPSVRLGPVKVMLSERDADPEGFRESVDEARAGSKAVAIHAVSESELVMALDALRPGRRKGPPAAPDRVEHGAIIPEALLKELRQAGVMVVGQPGLVHDRGDVYLREIDPPLHSWIHRARSLIDAGIPYAIGSDAPVLEPRPLAHFMAACTRLTRAGQPLGATETLTRNRALRAMTVGAARTVGMQGELGSIRPGALADVVVVDRETLESPDQNAGTRPVKLTIGAGRILWQRQNQNRAP
jgi:predicted amidohydrolase YtcJ